jgi:hypothetical protein
MNLDTLLKQNYVHDLVLRVCGQDTELVTRPESFMVRSKVEGDRDIHRIIVLPPRGYTADKVNQTNSHDEAEYATIEIKGAVRDEKNSFSVLRDCLLIASIPQNGMVSDLNKPYMTFDIASNDNTDLLLEKKSAGTAPFAVVKSDGYGFYHNLINLTDDWLVLQLYKKLRPQRSVNLAPHLKGLLTGQAQSLQSFYDAIVLFGDEIYEQKPNLIQNVLRIPVSHSLPALVDMLYVHDSGMHEACSVFATILKLGKMHPEYVTDYLMRAAQEQAVPVYYAEQLIHKIEKSQFMKEDGQTIEVNKTAAQSRN